MTSTSRKLRFRQISCLLLNYIKTKHVDIFKHNQNIRLLAKKKSLDKLYNLKKDFEARQVALEYFSSFQFISDILKSQLDVECLSDTQEICQYISG